MSKVFNPKNISKLESEERYKALPPIDTLFKTGLESGFSVADIGCGSGYFSIPAAKFVQPNQVFAVDISPEMLNHVNAKKIDQDLKNLEVVQMEASVIPLKNDSFDFTLCAFVAHEVQYINSFIDELLRITKPGGKLVIIEWQAKATPTGPPLDHRLDPETLNKHINSSFVTSKEMMVIGDWFYATIAHKR